MKILRVRLVLTAVVTFIILIAAGCSTSPQDKEAKYLKRGQKLLSQRDYERAVLEFRNAATAMPKDAEPHYQIGLAFIGEGNIRGATDELERATRLNPNHAAAQLRLAQIIEMAGKSKPLLENAEARLAGVVANEPANAEAITSLAFAEWRLGKVDQAEKRLTEALARTPANLHGSVNLARMKLAKKDFRGAEEVMQKAAVSAPKSEEAATALGELYLSMSQPDKAEAEFRRALQLSPRTGPALVGLAAAQIAGKRADLAEQTLQSVAALPDKQYRPQHALYLYKTGRREEAVAEFRKLAKEDPADRSARGRLTGALIETNKQPEAKVVLDEAVRKNPKDADALFERGVLYLKMGNYAEAVNDLNGVLHFSPNLAQVHMVMAEAQRAQGQMLHERQELNEALHLDRNLLPARLALARNLMPTDASGALKVIDEAPTAQKLTLEAIVQRNWILIELRRFKEAREFLKVLLPASDSLELTLQDAVLKGIDKDYASSRAASEAVLQRSPEDIRAVRLIVTSYLAQNQPEAAGKRLSEIVAARPRSAPLQFLLGQWYVGRGDGTSGRKAFETAKSLDPGFGQVDLAEAELDLAENRVDAARQRLQNILKTEPGNVPALTKLAGIEESSGDHRVAMEKYRAILNADSTNVFALNGLAYDLALSNPNEALQFAQRAAEIAPNNPDVEDTLGWVFYRKGIYAMATGHLKLAYDKSPTPQHQFHLAMSYLKQGEKSLGQQMLATALQKDPNLVKTEQGW